MQIETYAKEQRMPTLQEFSYGLCEDDEIQYVELESKKVGSLSKIEVGEAESIFTKLKEYPYEFEINSSLQLASIDGIKLADNNNDGTITITQSQYDSILSRLSALENNSNNINSSENYSTEEKIVGTWIDGKPIYKKVISTTITSGIKASTWTTIATDSDMSSVDTLLNIIAIRPSQKRIEFPSTFKVSNNNIQAYTETGYFAPKYLIVEYTKTDTTTNN